MNKSNKINSGLNNLKEDVMGFLNEIDFKYPKAVSLASGRPDENFFELENFKEYFDIYVDSIARSTNKSREEILNNLGQYHASKGIINDLVSKYLYIDENIDSNPEDIIITVGAQEALSIALMTLCDRDKDIILVEDPTYIGVTCFSIIAGYQIEPIPIVKDGISIERLEERIIDCKNQGKNVKIVYVIPDYQNPTGISMPIEKRQLLLKMANQYDFYIIEDNPYSDFTYQDTKRLSLKALDENKRVIYIRSFSKTLFPSLRLAAMVTNQIIINEEKQVDLSDLMAKTKGYITINTPSINQAILGGILIKNKFSLKRIINKKVDCIMQKRNQMVATLDQLLNAKVAPWAKNISWNVPEGGFFFTINLPFFVGKEESIFCAENYNVIFTPMSFFYFNPVDNKQIRIAFSNIPSKEIEPAIKNLVLYFKYKIVND